MNSNGNLIEADEKYLRERRSKIGMVFQQFNLFPHMTALQNCIEAPIEVLGMNKDEAEQRALDLLELVGLSDKKDEHPSRLSGGQQQRVALARALAPNPEVILLDEPSMGLAPQLVEEIFEIVKRLNEDEGVTFLLAEQNTMMALRYANYGYILENGRVVMDGEASVLAENEDASRFDIRRVYFGARRDCGGAHHRRGRESG